MANTVARTQKDVLDMTAAERLWDSMNYTYGNKREDLAKQYQQAVSQTDRGLLNRGMQRSSYGMQTLANLQQQGLKAQSDVWDTQIADYENRLQDIEQQEWQRDFSERQFDENVRQYNQNFTYQQGRDAVSDQQWQMAFDQNKGDNDRSLAASYVNALIAKGQMPTDDLLNRAGLSREDASKMLAQAAAAAGTGGSSGGRTGNTDTNKTPPPAGDGNELGGDAEVDAFLGKDVEGGSGEGTGRTAFDPYSNFINGLGGALRNAAHSAAQHGPGYGLVENKKIKSETNKKN